MENSIKEWRIVEDNEEQCKEVESSGGRKGKKGWDAGRKGEGVGGGPEREGEKLRKIIKEEVTEKCKH